jgi:hypothetical protein
VEKPNVTDTLLTQTAEFGADLLVMSVGIHGSGVSRRWHDQHLLEETTVPVLISR